MTMSKRLFLIRMHTKTRKLSTKSLGASKKPCKARRQSRRLIWTLYATNRRKVTSRQKNRRRKSSSYWNRSRSRSSY